MSGAPLDAALVRAFGHTRFRPGQREAAEALVEGRDVIAVMPTGAGKSLCCQLPATLPDGVTLVVSPLIALMKDQVDALVAKGIAAAALHSGQPIRDFMLIRLTPPTPISSVLLMPRPDFPRSLREFQARFADENACRRYLAASRWPDGFRCPRCGVREAIHLRARLLWRCKGCGHDTSVTAGTVLHRTRIPLTQWFWAAYLMTTHTPGVSALQLQRQLGIARYETVWAMLQKLRRAMVRPDREPLHQKVEVDDTYVGGAEVGLRGGRELREKALVVGAVEVRGTASGRVRLEVVPDASGPSLSGFVQANVEVGATVLTDGWQGYAPLAEMGYRHRARTQGGPKRAEKILPRIHRVFGNLKTWLRGTHHGVGNQHLQAYLDEFTFRFNRRRTPMAGFQTVLGLGAQRPPTTYNTLYGVESTG